MDPKNLFSPSDHFERLVSDGDPPEALQRTVDIKCFRSWLFENTIRHFRNRMHETGTLKRAMKAFDWQLHKKGCIPSGQIVNATGVE